MSTTCVTIADNRMLTVSEYEKKNHAYRGTSQQEIIYIREVNEIRISHCYSKSYISTYISECTAYCV